jgi:hypothetical protein
MRLVAALVVTGFILPVPPAMASCAEGSGPDGAPVIFVGSAESERRGYTRFAVEEVRAGPDLAPEVWVRSGEDQPPWPLSLLSAVGSSDDANFVHGGRYVVGASRSFDTGACSVTEADAGTRQPGARQPVDDGAVGVGPPIGPLGQSLWVAGVLALAAATVGCLRRRRHTGPGVTAPS